jgi:hypothetical protein
VTRKLVAALPPEFVAVTVTVVSPGAAAGRLTRPSGSTVAPPPATAKLRPPPAKAGRTSTTLPASCSRATSGSAATIAGGA